LVVQSRHPEHPVLAAAVHADPGRLVAIEEPMRRAVGLPPAMAMAVVSGAVAEVFVDRLRAVSASDAVTIQGPLDGGWRLRATDHRTLCDALAAVERPPGRLRVEVDPLGI
jgi:primosomal protein N' (replication factor Y)